MMQLNFTFRHGDYPPKGAILLFHGLTGSPYELKKYGQFLYGMGYDVYADSLPGHGEHFDDIYTVKYEDWLEFAYNEFINLKNKYDIVFVSGLCLGAVLALAVGIKFPKDVAGIISLSTTLFLDGWRLPWYSFLLPIGLTTVLRYYYNYPECEPHGIKNEKVRAVVKKLLEKGDVGMNDFPMTGIYELLKLSKVVRKNLKEVISPMLLVHSTEDDLTSIKSAYVTYKKVSTVYKDILVLNNSYHMVLYDNEREIVFDKVHKFLEECVSLEAGKMEAACI